VAQPAQNPPAVAQNTAPPVQAPPAAAAPRLLNDQQPAIRDGGERPAVPPPAPRPMVYGIVFGLLLIGAAIGLGALLVIRRWDRNRPIERETELAQHGMPRAPSEKRLAPQQHV
jgi:hypothetical protein